MNEEYDVSSLIDDMKAEENVENIIVSSGLKMVLNVLLGLKLILYHWDTKSR